MAKKLKPRAIFPLPLDGWTDDPRFLRMPAAGAGMTFRIIAHYWRTECEALPAHDSEWRSIARAQVATWCHHKTDIMSLVSDYAPAFKLAYQERLRKRRWIQHLAERSVIKRRERQQESRAERKRIQTEILAVPRKLAASPAVPPDIPSKAGGFRER
jgi:uncharacterized protein YdaU (DUF1376 family)